MENEAKRIGTYERLVPPSGGFTPGNVNSFLEENFEVVSRGVKFAIKKTGLYHSDRGQWEVLFQDGMLGVVEKLPKYHSNDSSLFTFVVSRASWKILDEFRKMNPVPRTVRKKMKEMSGLEPDEILRRAKSFDEYNSFFHAINPPISLDSLYDPLDGTSYFSDDCLVSDEVFNENNGNGHTRPVEDSIDANKVSDTLEYLLDPKSTILDCREKIILTKRICGKTMLEIGRELDISESRVCQLTERIRKKVDKELNGEI